MSNPGLYAVGMILVVIVKPGVAYSADKSDSDEDENFSTVDALLDLVR